MIPPISYRWDGEALIPSDAVVANRHLVVGERYTLVEHQGRSEASHRHEFAWLHEAWRNLPEALADLYPTSEHLRKRALIEGGFYDEMIVDAGTNAAALRVATAFRSIDDFALVIVRGPAVVRRTAKSQSRRAMDAKTFQDSKTAVLEVVAALIDVAPETLQRQPEAA